jgi:hypothetical protein
MRSLLILCLMAPLLMAAEPLPPVTLKLAPPHPGSTTYGPADMLCDLDKCHMFKVPGMPSNGTVDFQMPFLKGQERTDLRRCYSICRASAIGYPSEPEHRTPDQRNPSITIAVTELDLL